MRKLTKLSIEALRNEMPVLDKMTQQSICGGLDENDCWWRCVAYFKGDGNFSADDAMALASAYYGSSFNDSSYAFSGTRADFNAYVSENITCGACGSYDNGQILVFDPSQVSGWSGNSSSYHAVVVTGYMGDYVNVFDPQQGRNAQIKLSELNSPSNGFYVNINK